MGFVWRSLRREDRSDDGGVCLGEIQACLRGGDLGEDVNTRNDLSWWWMCFSRRVGKVGRHVIG